MNPRRGFTLIEMLIVITIIGVLAGLLLPALGLLRKGQRKAATMAIMNQVAQGVSAYLADWGRLGDTPAGFTADPWAYLHRNRIAAGKQPYLTLDSKQLASGSAGSYQKTTEAKATVILDAFITEARTNLLQWTIVNATSGTREYTSAVTIRSTCGTVATKDDIALHFTLESGRWEQGK